MKEDDDQVKEEGETLLYVGVALLVLALIFYVLPFAFVHYFTTFTFASVPKEDNVASICRELFFSWFKPEHEKSSFTIKTISQPDQDFLFSYVYGCMGSKMPEFHAFSHLASDGLTGKFDPQSLKDLEAMA